MNIKKIVFSAALVSLTYLGQSQYVSGVTTPDNSKPKIENKTDVAYNLASGITASNLRSYLKVLASDSLQGRETGTEGSKLASNYIANFLRNLGLEGRRETGAYLQPATFTFSRWSDTDVYVNGERYRLLWDYIADPKENENQAIIKSKDILYLGYGIDDPKYSDYKKVDVKDKVIMISNGEPWNAKKGISFITGTSDTSAWSKDINKKLKVAKEKGAKLVLIMDDNFKETLDKNRRNIMMPGPQMGDFKDKKLDIANNVYISPAIVKAIIGNSEKQFNKAKEKVAKGKPANATLPTDFVINMSKNVSVLKDNNIVGYVRGKSKPDEYVIISAHYDHIGKRGEEIFNGADDNGSGSSAVMELARVFQEATYQGNRPERSVVFLWFTGEEKGLLGSQFYSENPIFPLEQTIADINIDMVGRIDDKYKDKNINNYIYVIGSDRLSTDLHKITEDVNQKYTQLTLDYTYNAEEDPNKFYYRSDHYNFAKHGIPAVFFFNGVHDDYHRSTDKIEKIDFDTMAERTKLIFHIAWDLANRPDKIKVDGVVK